MSQELSKVLGIYKYEHRCPECEFIFNEYYTDKHYCDRCGCYSWSREDGSDKNIVEIPVDFKEPNNFITLIGLSKYLGGVVIENKDEYERDYSSLGHGWRNIWQISWRSDGKGFQGNNLVDTFISFLIFYKHRVPDIFKEKAREIKWK